MAATMGPLLIIAVVGALTVTTTAQEATVVSSRGSCDARNGFSCPESDMVGPAGFSLTSTPVLTATVDPSTAATPVTTPLDSVTRVQLNPSAVVRVLAALSSASTMLAKLWSAVQFLKADLEAEEEAPLLMRPLIKVNPSVESYVTIVEEGTLPPDAIPQADGIPADPASPLHTVQISVYSENDGSQALEEDLTANAGAQGSLSNCYSSFDLVTDTCPDLATNREITTLDIMGQWGVLFGYSRSHATKPFCADVVLTKHVGCRRTVTLQWSESAKNHSKRPMDEGDLFVTTPGFLVEPEPGTKVVKLLYRQGRFLLLAVCDQTRNQEPRVLVLGRDIRATSDGEDLRALMALWRTLHTPGAPGPSWYLCQVAYNALSEEDTATIMSSISIGPRPDGSSFDVPYDPNDRDYED